MHGWVRNDAGGCCSVHATQKQARGGHRGHGGTYFRVHCTEGKREKTQMVAEGHRCMMTDILGMLGALMVVDRCVGVDGAQ